MGWRNPPELMTAELDHMYAAGVYAMISIPTAGHCNQTAKPGKPVPNCTAEYENMLGNMTLVKEHPATWGYYICDDCKILTLSRIVALSLALKASRLQAARGGSTCRSFPSCTSRSRPS